MAVAGSERSDSVYTGCLHVVYTNSRPAQPNCLYNCSTIVVSVCNETIMENYIVFGERLAAYSLKKVPKIDHLC